MSIFMTARKTLYSILGLLLVSGLIALFTFGKSWLWSWRFLARTQTKPRTQITAIPTCLGCNLVFVDLGPLEARDWQSPSAELAAIQRQSYVFTRAYSQGLQRAPNQMAVLTSNSTKSLANSMRERGYRTFYFGPEPTVKNGFQKFHSLIDGIDRLSFSEALLEREPFFGYIEIRPLPRPNLPPTAIARALDLQVNLIWSTLKGLDKLKNTVVVVFSTQAKDGAPFLQERIHIPLVIFNPQAKEPSTVDDVTSLVDLMPFTLNLFGAPAPSGLAGRDLMHPESPQLSFAQHESEASVFDGEWRFVRAKDGREKLFYLPLDLDETENLIDLSSRWSLEARQRLRRALEPKPVNVQ